MQYATGIAVRSETKGGDKGRHNTVPRTRLVNKCGLAHASLVENSLADSGPVRVYVRVKDPDGILLMNNESTGFTSGGAALQATASREVDYEGSEVDLSIYVKDTGEFVKGIYTLEVYTEQAFLGRAECMLR